MLERIPYLVILVLLLAGCRQGVNDSAGLVELDSLIAAAPDSAAARLADWPADSLRTAGDRAYHALLLTQARYKAYIPLDSGSLDTINLAVAHYADGHDPDKLMRSLLYKGCVFEELARLDSAMYYYKAAEDHAARSGDTYHQGYALMRMASLFQSHYAKQEAIDCFRQTLSCMRVVREDHDVLYALQELGNLYLTVNMDSAKHFIDEALNFSLQLDSCKYAYTLASKAAFCLRAARYDECVSHGKESIKLSSDRLTLFSSCNWVAQAYALLGCVDSSRKYFAMSPLPQSKSDSVLYLRTMASIRRDDSTLYRLQAGNIADTLVDVPTISRLNRGAASYTADKMRGSVRHAALTTKWIALSLTLFALTLVLILYYARKRHVLDLRRHNRELAQKEDEIEAKDATIHSKEQALHEIRQKMAKQSETIKLNEKIIGSFAERIESLKKQIGLIQQDVKEVKDSYVGEHLSHRNDVLNLMEQLKLQIVEAHKGLSYGSSAQDAPLRTIRDMFNDNFCKTFIAATLIAYPCFASALEGHELPRKDMMTVCMHLAGFPNAVIRDYLGVSRDHTVTNKKRDLAKSLGVDSLDQFKNSGSGSV
ncbi:MAG: hypothetical protein IJ724_13580 [Muribaculaceae bacterium]|nr:hypothetical protein [Muribaculaceae bacterium]